MSEFSIHPLLDTGTVTVKNVRCDGTCRHLSAEECARATHLVFPYRGLYLRHVGSDQSVADANHVLFFNGGEGYRVSHPLDGGDSSLVLAASPELLRELAPPELLQRHDDPAFRLQSLRIDPRAQALVALLRHSLGNGGIEALEAESLALTLVGRSLGPRTTHATGATHGRRRLVDRVKVLLASDLGRQWKLADIAAQIGGSPVYLTQAFAQVEGMPLHRYHLRLRLARALDRLPQCEDVSALAMDLGFSSHSHFASAFRQVYGRTPSEFRASALAKSA
ncbi:MAG TPA: AraC family transcriptional regulator [Lysobacter sp.]